MRGTLMTACVLALVLAAGTAIAEPKVDDFFVQVGEDGHVIAGGGSGGSGYADGTWYEYPNTQWWNEWFYDDPPDPDRWKEISLMFTINPLDPSQGSYAEVTYNWSTLAYPESGPGGAPPLPPLDPLEEEDWIVRAEPYIYAWDVPVGGEDITDGIIIPDYNPEWISIDIRGYNFEIIGGTLWHECVPEPATLSLLALGGFALLRRRKS